MSIPGRRKLIKYIRATQAEVDVIQTTTVINCARYCNTRAHCTSFNYEVNENKCEILYEGDGLEYQLIPERPWRYYSLVGSCSSQGVSISVWWHSIYRNGENGWHLGSVPWRKSFAVFCPLAHMWIEAKYWFENWFSPSYTNFIYRFCYLLCLQFSAAFEWTRMRFVFIVIAVSSWNEREMIN